MYERHHQPPISTRAFARRVLRHFLLAGAVIVLALALGVLGYRATEHMEWVDALLNASMILGGMGPVDTLRTSAGKLFAAGYALFSGLVFVGSAGILIAPVLHRLLHHYHWDASA
jgi:hypothetical protein